AGRTAAAVAPAKGKDHRTDAVGLQALVPTLEHRLRPDLGVIVGEDVSGDGRPVDALPPERVIWEGVAAVIRPGDLLGGKTDDAASVEDLRQRAGIAKYVRQPEHAAV